MQVDLRKITVRFGPLRAVDDVGLRFESGQVHAVVGENGAGKSTIMKVLFGLIRPDHGELLLNGTPQHWAAPQDSISRGFGMVHQHFMLQPSMTVLENILLCAEPAGVMGFVRFGEGRKAITDLLDRYAIELDLDHLVGHLSVGRRQLVEIVKLLYRRAEMLILDEPTSVLTPLEKDRLFGILRVFQAEGKAIALVTHKLDEVMELASQVSVMRGGKLMLSCPIADTTRDGIARHIIGGDLPAKLERNSTPATSATHGIGPAPEAILEVRDLQIRTEGAAKPIGPLSLSVHSGEILGIAGVSGNGQAELAQAIVGLRPSVADEITLCGKDLQGLTVAERRESGLSYIPEDRQLVGLALDARLRDNVSVGRLNRPNFRHGIFLAPSIMNAFAAELITYYRIRAENPMVSARTLSGGNRQKLVVGRELSAGAPLVVVENPTWGVDIGSIDFIHRELIAIRDAGCAILLVSNELDEILELSDRILVMSNGQLSREFPADKATREDLGELMLASETKPPKPSLPLGAVRP